MIFEHHHVQGLLLTQTSKMRALQCTSKMFWPHCTSSEFDDFHQRDGEPALTAGLGTSAFFELSTSSS
jgi:hypothetical protein